MKCLLKSTASLFVFAVAIAMPAAHAAGQVQLRDSIDQHVAAAWSRQQVEPATLADDAEFLRRIYLDLIGIIPNYEEAVAFLADTSSDKREKLVSRLLNNPRFGVHQSDLWDMVYFGRNPPGFGTRERDGFKNWLRDQFNDNVPYDVWARSILQAEGNTVEDGAPMFFVQYKNAPEDATEAVTEKFLGIQLQCARCHDHPFDDWTQLDFYGMAAFFARVRVVDIGKKGKLKAFAIGEKNTGEVLFTGPAMQQRPGKKGTPVPPTFLGGKPLEEPPPPENLKEPRNFKSGKLPPPPIFSRKSQLATWITSRDNPYFARAIANRIWAQFMGKGIVHPVSNLSPNNPPSHPELLDLLAKSLVEHDFDLKWFIAEIVNSRTYQLTSRGAVREAKPLWYERARYRPLSAEELLESWVVASQYDKVLKADGKPLPPIAKIATSKERLQIRGLTWNYILQAFGRPDDGVGNFQGGLKEHLYLNNGQIRQLISTRPGSLHALLSKSDQPWEARVERLFVQVLSRPPDSQERKRFVDYLSADDDASGRLHDAIWTLMTCSEFRLNH